MEVDEWMDGWIRTMVHSLLIQDSPIVPREFSKISIAIKVWHIKHPYCFKSHCRLVHLLTQVLPLLLIASQKTTFSKLPVREAFKLNLSKNLVFCPN